MAAVIAGSTIFLDLHSSSAAAPAFAFHTPGAVPEAHAATLPVRYLIEDTTLVGTTIAWAAEQGVARAALLESAAQLAAGGGSCKACYHAHRHRCAALAPFLNGVALNFASILLVSGQCVQRAQTICLAE